jgi:zinc transport system ATP-binding protein
VQIVEVRSLSYILDSDILLLDKIDFDVYLGDLIAITGPNGAGKTTFIKILLGILQPKTGIIKINTDKIGYVPQKVDNDISTLPFDVKQIINFGAKDNIELLKYAIDIMELDGLEKKFWRELSGGQRQRTLIAKAIASNAKLFVMDEPTAGLDINTQNRFYSWIGDMCSSKKIATLLVTHDCASLSGIYHRKVIIDQTLTEVKMGCHGHR